MIRVRALALPVLRVASLVALGFSTALLIDYLRPVPSFCALGSGCSRVKALAGYLAGVPIPALGVSAFGALLSLTLWPGGRRVARAGALGGAVVAVGLLAWQKLGLGVLCWMCAVVDASAIVAGLAALLWRPEEPVVERLRPLGWAGLALLAIGLPHGVARAKPPPAAPASILALSDPAHVTIVEFSDFECPFCRIMHPVLLDAVRASGAPARIVRKTFPLPSHPHARGASRAWVCAERAGAGERMADWLFGANDLAVEAISRGAEQLGLDRAALVACMADPATDARIDADIAFIRAAGFEGLPTVWIGDRKVLGAQPVERYTEAIRAVARGERPTQSWWQLAAIILASLMLVISGWRRHDAA